MKFLLINGSKAHPNAAKAIIAEAKKYFSTVLSVPINKIRVECGEGENKIFYKDTDLTTFDVCFPRLFGEDFTFGSVVLDILENSDVYMPTGLDAFQISSHKYYTTKIFAKIGIPVPATALSVGEETATRLAHRLGFPLVVKLLSGFGGKGVMMVQDEKEFKPLFDTFEVFKEFLLMQEFMESRSEDLRCYVFGEKIFAIKRKGGEGEWRANVSRGGSATIIELPEKYEKLVLDSTRILGMDFGAVDILETRKGPVVVEANFSPGFIIKFFGDKFVNHAIREVYKTARVRG